MVERPSIVNTRTLTTNSSGPCDVVITTCPQRLSINYTFFQGVLYRDITQAKNTTLLGPGPPFYLWQTKLLVAGSMYRVSNIWCVGSVAGCEYCWCTDSDKGLTLLVPFPPRGGGD